MKKNHQEIRNILTVLGTAIICAILLAFVLIYYYSPSGLYIAGNTLLDPSVMEQLNIQDKSSKRGHQIDFILDRIEFSYLNSQNQIRKQKIPLEVYGKFYSLIASEKSLKELPDHIHDLFIKSHPAVLSITMHTVENSIQSPTKIFQQVESIEEDYFRIQLHERQGEWAYFYRPHIYQDMIHLFAPSNDQRL